MSVRDREVLDLLGDDPELLAIADAVADTQQARRLRPLGAMGTVALAVVAIFVLFLAAPWDRGGGGRGNVLDRALAAVGSKGEVVHLTMRMDVPARGPGSPRVVNESFYDQQAGLVRVISRSAGKVVGDYTTRAAEDEFSFFPGLLEGAAYYKQALANGDAHIVGKGVWEGRPVYWLELERGGGLMLRIGIDPDSYRPVVFRALNPDGTFAGAQVAVLGFDYVSRAQAAFDNSASVLASGRVVGPDCRPVKARVDAVLRDQLGANGAIASVRTGPDGRFVLKANPRRSPVREALLAGNGTLNIDLNAIASKGGAPRLIGFFGISRSAKGGRWVEGPPVTIQASNGPNPGC